MSRTKKTHQLLNHFSHITLDQLNASYSLMERLDRKYIVSLDTLDDFLEKIQSDYHVLAIKNTKIFKYDSMYMDTLDRLMYHHHNDQESVRMKVRSRRYVDSNICFFEIKQKDNNLTRKFRIPYPFDTYEDMDHNATMFFDGVCTSMGTMKGKKLQPSLRIQYNRITLCSKTTDEKITIDTDIVFHDMHRKNSPAIVMPPMAIIEAKSAQKKPASSKVLTKL